MSEITKFKINSQIIRGEYNNIPKREFLATLPGGAGDVAVVVWGRDGEKCDAWDLGQIIEMTGGMTMEPKGPIKGGDFKGKQGYKLSWPKAGGGYGSKGGWKGGGGYAVDCTPDFYLTLQRETFLETLEKLVAKEPRAFAEALPVAAQLTNTFLIATGLRPIVKSDIQKPLAPPPLPMPEAKDEPVPF